jgi:endonuclease G
MQYDDQEKLVEILATLATDSGVDPKDYFRNTVNQADLPRQWRGELAGIWKGNSNIDARNLINWCLVKEVNPQDRRFTTLGSILMPLLQSVGFETASFIVALIIRYDLYRDKNLLETLKLRYQVPLVSDFTKEVINIGPEIEWQGPEEIQLQSWIKPDPDFLDVGFLMQAIQRATSVCRIEIPGQGIQGTGFLVAQDLVLTNYHVLKPSDEADMDANARNTILRFGCFTSNTGNETEGQVFKLVTEQPIVKSSPIENLDYALLRVEDKIWQAKDIEPVRWDCETLPMEKMGLNILQHPEGASMKISLSSNGITGVYEESGLIQYVTKTSLGSSGAPCFNKDWKVVALHHAQRSKSFGTIREGILFSSIYREIKSEL